MEIAKLSKFSPSSVGITFDYLVDFTDIPYPLENQSEETLSPTEKDLIENYRHLSPAYRNLINALVETHLKELVSK